MTMRAVRTRVSSAARGFTLVEVLVALVVMSVGMLGIAALYLEGLRAGRTAVYRTTAVNLAADIWTVSAPTCPPATPMPAPVPALTSPASTAMRTARRFNSPRTTGSAGIATSKRSCLRASAEIQVDAAPSPVYTITLAWPEIGQTEAASYSLRLQP